MPEPLQAVLIGSVALLVAGVGITAAALAWLWRDGRRTCC